MPIELLAPDGKRMGVMKPSRIAYYAAMRYSDETGTTFDKMIYHLLEEFFRMEGYDIPHPKPGSPSQARERKHELA